MQITLADKEHTLYFGIAFIREMDKRYWLGDAAAPFGVGVESAWLQLSRYNMVMLKDVLAAGLVTDFTFTDKDFDQFFEANGEDALDKLCDELVKNLEALPQTKSRVKAYKTNLQEMAKQNENSPETPTEE